MTSPLPKEYPLLWLQGSGCTGCSISLLNSVSPSTKNLLIDEVVPGHHLNLRYHPNVMAGAGEAAIQVLEETRRKKKKGYILIVEGALPTAQDGVFGSLGEEGDRPIPITRWAESLGRDALAVIAMGTCAAFGGIPAGQPNPTQCLSVGQFFKAKKISTPVINVPGCPPHPDWLVGTVAGVLLHGLPKPEEMDEFGRPKAFYGALIHEHCPRRSYYDEKKFAKKLSDPGCLYELGCKGPITYADCPTRLWNHGTNWCVGAGAPCQGCVEPGFPDLTSPFYEKMP